ncbi:hypothetical protein [Planktothrix agardhii]|jgi:hypothetical protein|uniref:hypothetical protein n=1 Tax=Planktothrix agardhii TaxID=1160 RepID=UPI001D0B4285|nr:hypothetical protein [Planktothrix agardhii]MCF3607884.1 hypothetical protein [Planktothrix agardhii 1033]
MTVIGSVEFEASLSLKKFNVEIPYNPYQGLKQTIRRKPFIDTKVEIPYNPYQGLKRFQV